MDRRNFLIKSLILLAGGMSGIGSIAKSYACERQDNLYASSPIIALIIDDIGFSLSRARQFLNINVPITFSILPRLPKSPRLASEIASLGHEIMLHQPMEPYNSYIDPGPGALYVGDNPEKINRILIKHFEELPQASGVNNHMGSRFTACSREMNQALTLIKKKELYFVDSITTGSSKGYSTARNLCMPAARRNIFLDNSQDEAAILGQLKKLTRHALKYGHAIGIGHPFRETANAIASYSKAIQNTPVRLGYISDILGDCTV